MEEAATRPEDLMNSLFKLRMATRNIANGLGVLALLWSTVVLLGGFISVLPIKEFWVLTGMSFVMACRMLDFTDDKFFGEQFGFFDEGRAKWLIYVEEACIVGILRRLEPIGGQVFCFSRIIFVMLLVPKLILLICVVFTISYVPYVSLGISVWRLVRRDYGDAGADAANSAKLTAALDIFYALVLFQSLFILYWILLVQASEVSVYMVASLTNKQRGYEKWIPKVVLMYYKETKRKFHKDGELPYKWNLIRYGGGLLQSASGDDDHLWGVRLLDKLFDDNKDIISVRQELLSTSSSSVQNLIGMIICRRSTADSVEKRERAARILAHLASDLHITHFPGTLQCICSLLDSSCNQFCEEPQVTCQSSEINPDDEESRSQLETSNHQHDARISVPIQGQTGHEHQVDGYSSSAGLAQRKQTTLMTLEMLFKERERRNSQYVEDLKQHKKDIKEWRRYTYRSRGVKKLISHGLLILERLTQDVENCTEIMKHQRLLFNITSPLSSHHFLSNMRDGTMVKMLSKSLTVVSRLLTCHGGCITRLHQELASNTEAVSNLMAILETDSESSRQLHQQALEILTELAFDDSFKMLEFNKLFKALIRILFEEEASNTIVEEASNTKDEIEEANRDKATRLRGIAAGEALARLLPVRTARGVNAAHILSKQEAINLLTKALHLILLSSKMGTENVVENEPPEEDDCVQPHTTQGDKKQSEERTFLTAMLSLAVVIWNENVITREDFARVTPEDAELVKKLKEILKVNKQCTAEGLRVVKLTCQMVIAMIRAKPSCIQHFHEHNFKEALTVALEIMSEVDNCLLFAGNDRKVIKPARSLASLVKEARELLNTAQEQGT